MLNSTGKLTFMNSLKFQLRYEKQYGFYDFLIDGKSLFDICDMENTDRVGIFGRNINSGTEKFYVKQFLNEIKNNELDSGRIMVFVCAECGDIGCGATTFNLVETENSFIWTDFGDEDIIDGIDTSEYNSLGPFEFNKNEYKRLFKEYFSAIGN